MVFSSVSLGLILGLCLDASVLKKIIFFCFQIPKHPDVTTIGSKYKIKYNNTWCCVFHESEDLKLASSRKEGISLELKKKKLEEDFDPYWLYDNELEV